MRKPIITSLLDLDLYKLTMMQAFYHAPEFRSVDVEWKFNCRNGEGKGLGRLIPELRNQVSALCKLRFTQGELIKLSGLRYMKTDFIDYLRMFQLDERNVIIQPEGDEMSLRIRGTLLHVMLFEIYLLAIISELWTEIEYGGVDLTVARKKLMDKVKMLKGYVNWKEVQISDFSTRRRASRDWQFEMVDILRHEIPEVLAGTSNVYLAFELGLTPIGTMAHEWFQAWQAVGPRLVDAQKAALEGWVREYRGDLGIALTDCYNMDSFERDFDLYFAKLYDGLRHDSACPFNWGGRFISLYDRHGIDPRTKTQVFSDSLNIPKVIDLHKEFRKDARPGFGVGTNLGNDVGIEPLNIVIKMVRANGQAVAKISDEPGKSMCEDLDYLRYVAKVHQIDPDTVIARA